MKVLQLAFPSGVQFRLMFDQEIPPIPIPILASTQGIFAAPGDMHAGADQVVLVDDYGQTISYSAYDTPVVFTQDTALVDRLEVALMVRQKTNEIAAMQQLQSNPANMIVHPGRGLVS